MRRSKITAVEKRLFAEEWNRGATRKHLSKLLNASPHTLSKLRKRMELEPRARITTENTHFVGFYVTPELDRAITVIARADGFTKSAWLRKLVLQSLKV